MKKIILGAFTFAAILSSCSGTKSNEPSIIGSWVMPVAGQPGKVEGVKIEENGVASSINMQTLIYEKWQKEGDHLYMTVKSVGNGMTIGGMDTLTIDKLTADSLIVTSKYGYTLQYVREKTATTANDAKKEDKK